ncbi:MAG: PEP-CTERM sorting domain-containing protein [Armatimonadota bacterium]
MKKIMVLAIVAMMVMVFAASANAYLIRAQGANATGGASSVAGSLGGSEATAAFTPLGAAVSAEATYAVFSNNDPVNGTLGHTLKFTTSPVAWYGTVVGRGGYTGDIYLRFFSTTTASKLAGGTWYLYKGIQTVVDGKVKAEALDSGKFATTESSWATSTFGSKFQSGDNWTLTQGIPDVPEPGSMLAMMSGLVGLVGFGIRRRK